MDIVNNQNANISLRSKNLVEIGFTATVQERNNIITPSTSSESTEGDVVWDVDSGAVHDKEADIIIGDLAFGTSAPTFESSDEGVATVDANGKVSRVSDGTVTITVTNNILTRKVNVTVARISPGEVKTFNRWVDGTLAKECSDNVDTRITGSEDKEIYSVMDHDGQSYIRNANCWANDLDLTCISPWNTHGQTRGGTLISPRHILFSEHYRISVGSVVRFVKADGTVVDRIVTARQDVGLPNAQDGYVTDLCVGLLDSDVPEGINFCKVLPSDVADHFTHLSLGVPCLTLDQEKKALITDLISLSTSGAGFRKPTDVTRLTYYEPKILYDSGWPAFLIIDDELVLVTVWTFGGAGSGPNIAANLTTINTAMTTLGGGYTLTQVDLTEY